MEKGWYEFAKKSFQPRDERDIEKREEMGTGDRREKWTGDRRWGVSGALEGARKIKKAARAGGLRLEELARCARQQRTTEPTGGSEVWK